MLSPETQEGQQLADGALAQEAWGLGCTQLGGMECQSTLCPGSLDTGTQVGRQACALALGRQAAAFFFP